MSLFPSVVRFGVGALVLLGGVLLAARPAEAALLTFDDITLGPDGRANVFGFYQDPASTFLLLGDFQARGPGADADLTAETSTGSGTVSTSLAPFSGGPVTLIDADATPFTLRSIDIARDVRVNEPGSGVSYPQVTFTGTTSGGAIVSQTFVVDQADFFFQTFSFSSDFTDLVAVSWTQPAFGTADPDAPGSILGLHQFDNIRIGAAIAPVPEPATLSLLGLGAAIAMRRGRQSLARRRRGA